MATLPDVVKIAIDQSATACVATSDLNGVSNVIYVSYLKYLDDDTIVIADNKFAKTRSNLDSNPKLSFVVLNTETKKSYQVKGSVKCYTEGSNYQDVVDWVQKTKPELTPKAAFYLKVEEVYCGAERIA